jgi:hypothetical protein
MRPAQEFFVFLKKKKTEPDPGVGGEGCGVKGLLPFRV